MLRHLSDLVCDMSHLRYCELVCVAVCPQQAEIVLQHQCRQPPGIRDSLFSQSRCQRYDPRNQIFQSGRVHLVWLQHHQSKVRHCKPVAFAKKKCCVTVVLTSPLPPSWSIAGFPVPLWSNTCYPPAPDSHWVHIEIIMPIDPPRVVEGDMPLSLSLSTLYIPRCICTMKEQPYIYTYMYLQSHIYIHFFYSSHQGFSWFGLFFFIWCGKFPVGMPHPSAGPPDRQSLSHPASQSHSKLDSLLARHPVHH